MLFDYRAFWLAKDPQHADDYQDAYAVDPARGRAAIADGVSASLFAARWAGVLVRSAVDEPPAADDAAGLSRWLGSCRAQWSCPIAADTLAWHQRLKLHEGAFSTLLWFEFESVEAATSSAATFRLRARSVGDSCLLHVRDNHLCRSFPLSTSREFGTQPATLSSAERPVDRQPAFETLEIECHSGDLVALATDAVAAWSLAQAEAGTEPDWEATWRMPESKWRQRIKRLRSQGQMRYDDATLVLVRLRASG